MSRFRMAGEIPEGLDRLIKEIRDEGKEELKQEAIVQNMHPEVSVSGLMNGTSRTAEQQVARDLLFRGEMPDALPADLYSASDLADKSELGIAGPYQSDSAIKQSTTGGLVSQTFDGETDQILEVNHLPVRTEFLSENSEERLFDTWKKLGGTGGRRLFNADVGEYYGQQALRLVGANAVSDANRSDRVKNNSRGPAAARLAGTSLVSSADSTKGTDRLIENSVGILNDDIDFSGDYRYDINGEVRVGDYQAGDTVNSQTNPLDTIRLNLLKQVEGSGTSPRAIKDKWARTERQLMSQGIQATPIKVMQAMLNKGELPPRKRGSFGVGIRGGKSVAADPMFRNENRDSQYRYDDILFGHTDINARSQPYGYIPDELILVDNRKALNALGNSPSDIMVMGGSSPGQQKSVNVIPKVDDLIAAGAAERISDRPLVRQLFW